jgi:ABC-type polysaccharide/polyol phosphate transport system ATPase subunit
VSFASDNAVEVVGVSKRYRFPSLGKQATLKDVVVRHVVHEGRYGVVDALDDVTFTVPKGQTLGVIGVNGSGKSTLLRILAGITKPDRGEVRLRGTVAPLLALGAGFNPYFTGRENALIELLSLGLSRAQALAELDAVINFSELGDFIDAPMRTYSDGMTMRLAFAAAIRIDPDILLIDEVLSVGDERFAAKCTAWLDGFRSRGKTAILVTHSTGDVLAQCELALWLREGRVAAYGDKVDVVRAYVEATRGKPIADTLPVRAESVEQASAIAERYRRRIVGMLPLLRLPIVGFVRQSGTIKGGYEDGWTDGALEFTIEPLRDVRAWSVRVTVPPGMAQGDVAIEVDGTRAAAAPAAPGELVLRCEKPLRRERPVRVRIVSQTVNQSALGIGSDERDLGARIDEIFFEHEPAEKRA